MNNRNELNTNIDFNQTQEADLNHDFNDITSQSISKSRIIKLI